MSRRNRITYQPGTVTKHFSDPTAAQQEIRWYLQIPWAAPTLVGYTERSITITRHPPAAAHHLDDLIELLHRLDSNNIHHRDVHPGNIVATPTGPKLIDWETCIEQDAPSYDLHGPDSGVPPPDIHAALKSGYRMWLTSPHPMSVANLWRFNAETSLPSRVGRQGPPQPTGRRRPLPGHRHLSAGKPHR